MRILQEGPTTVYQDNKQTIAIMNDVASMDRARGFDIKMKYVQDLVKRKCIVLEYLPSESMLADGLNKAVGKNIFLKMRQGFGLNYPSNSGGERCDRDKNMDENEEVASICNMRVESFLNQAVACNRS